MGTDKTTENCLQQPVAPYHNLFDDTRLEKRSIITVDGDTLENQLFYSPVRINPINNDHTPTHIPVSECFSIQPATGTGQSTPQSSSVLDNNLHHPPEIYNQDRTDSCSRLTAQVEGESDKSCFLQDNRDQNDSAYAKRKRDRERERYQNDPDYAARKNARQRMRRKDPAYKERERERERKDPAYAERKRKQRERTNEYQKERRKDPAYAERLREWKRQYMKKRCKDPTFVERERERNRKYQRERLKDPVFAERERKRKREYLKERRKDPAFVEHERKRNNKTQQKGA